MIGAQILFNKYAFVIKRSTTKSKHIVFFFELLYEKCSTIFGKDFASSTIFVFDNARVHTSKDWKEYFKKKGLSVMTCPPYTPEQNKVEYVFRKLKTDLSHKSLFKKRLEFVVAETIINMK